MNTLTQSERILSMLKSAGRNGVPNWQLAEVSLQYNARIYTLRHRDGQDIRKTRIYHGTRPTETFKYYLVGPTAPPPKARVVEKPTRIEPIPQLFIIEPIKHKQEMKG